jgi:V/A-type H+-transporting ATPase subunit C
MARTLLVGNRYTNYPYAIARVQAKKAKLIPTDQYEKLLKMDLSEITRFVEEGVYKSEVDELSTRFSGLDLFEAALTVNEERTYAAIRELLSGPGQTMVAAFLLRHFVEDIKTVLRGKNAGATKEELLQELILEDLDTFNVFGPILNEDLETIDDVVRAFDRAGGMAKDWAGVLQKVPSGSPLPAYEDALDKAYYAKLLMDAKAFKGKAGRVMEEFVHREIDARNLQNASRWVAAGQTDDFSPYVIPGGSQLKTADIMALSSCDTLAALDEVLSSKKMYDAVREGLAASVGTGRLSAFSVAIKRWHLASLDRLSHGNPLSIIPILSFLLRKRQEVVTLRAIGRGKAAGLSEARLRELLP